MKESLRGIKFESLDDIIHATKASLNDLVKHEFLDAFEGLLRRWEKRVANECSYFE